MNGPHPAAAGEPRSAGPIARAKGRAKQLAHGLFGPVVAVLDRTGIRPDHVTVLGFVLSLGAAFAFFEGEFQMGAVLVAASGLCDILDGELARHAGVQSRFGAFLDSTLDRASEAIILAGICGFYVTNLLELVGSPERVIAELSRGFDPRAWAIVALTAVLALIGSFLVSYTRARAEGLGFDCKVGWFERPERIVLLIVAGAFGVSRVMPAALLLLTGFSFATAAQRVAHVWKLTRGADRDAG